MIPSESLWIASLKGACLPSGGSTAAASTTATATAAGGLWDGSAGDGAFGDQEVGGFLADFASAISCSTTHRVVEWRETS